MLTSIGDVMREAHKRGWITTRDGNISIRRGNNFYITPSNVRKPIIVPEMIIKGKVNGDQIEIGMGSPSGEFEMHRMLQTSDFSETRTVVHLHPTYTIAAIYRGFDLKKIAAEFPEVSRYTRVGPTVPVLPVVSKELANATFEAITDGQNKFLKYDIVGQAGHGVCAIGKSPWDAFEHIERLEHVCQIVLSSGVAP